jgi:MFS transporter, DHA2 family, multidrug resistance protein
MNRRRSPSHRIRVLVRKQNSFFHPRNKYYKWIVLANVMFGTFMAVLDATVVNVGLPKIMASFGVGLDKIEWVITAYMLAMAVMLPTSGWLADRFGYKRMYFFGLLLFTAGSFLCGMAVNENMLITSRIIQGLGGGIIQPLGMAIITREFPVKQRGIALGFWAIASAASVSFGPMIGGFLIDNFSWQLIFDINIPVGILAMLFTIIIQSEHKSLFRRKFDLIGFISVSIFLPLTLYTLSEGNAASNSAGWHAPYILFCGAISVVAFVIFITTELTIKEPLIDLKLLKNRNFGLGNVIMLLFSLGMFGSTFLMPIYLQNTMGYTALQAGRVFLPVGIIQGIVAPISGRISDKISAKLPGLTGVILLSFSFYLNTKLSFMSEMHSIMISLYLRGLAMGMIFTSLTTVSLLQIPKEKMAQAAGIANSIRQLGGSLGVAILATLLTTRINYHAQQYGGALNSRSEIFLETSAKVRTYMMHNAGSSPSEATSRAQYLMLSNLNTQAYIQGINDDFFVACVVMLVGGIPIIFLRTKKSKIKHIPSHDHV